MSNYFDLPSEGELVLAHHGILGQRWGIRRYQNADGSLTDAGRARYGTVENLRKIQNARSDAAAYKIRAKAEAKAAKANAKLANKMAKAEDKRQDKIAKEDLKREKKILKERNKYQIQNDKRYNKEMQKDYNKNYNKEQDRSKSKRIASEAFNNIVKPVIFEQGRNILNKYAGDKISELGMSEAQKAERRLLNNAKKKVEKYRILSEAAYQEAMYEHNTRQNDYEKYMTKNYTNAPINDLQDRRTRYDISSGAKYKKK